MPGPTSFIVKESGLSSKFKVALGGKSSCSCPGFRSDDELCTHILWVLLRKLRVPRSNPINHQKSLVPRELDQILCGARRDPGAGAAVSQSDAGSAAEARPTVTVKDVTEDDVCPICQEELLETGDPLTHCRHGCGGSVHLK